MSYTPQGPFVDRKLPDLSPNPDFDATIDPAVDADTLNAMDQGIKDANDGLAGKAAAPKVVAVADLGAAYTLDMAGESNLILAGTLTANCTITIAGVVPGDRGTLALTQDAAGGHSCVVAFGADTTPTVALNTDALAGTSIDFYAVAVDDLRVVAGAASA